MIDPLTSTAFAIHNGKGVYALLLGSGISRSANVPTGWEVTLDLVRKVAATLNQVEQCSTDPEEWYRVQFGCDPTYSDLLQQLALQPAERTAALARYFEGSDSDESAAPQPTAAHLAIAKMVKRGYFRVILTTNFDRLIERALESEGISPTVLSSSDAIQGSMPLVHSSCVVVKLHGDYRDVRLRNTVVELSEYDSHTQALVDRVLDEYGLIVSGWSATWDVALRKSIMRETNRRFTTVWTFVSQLSFEAQQLVQLRQAQAIKVSSADRFFTELNEKLEALEKFDAPHPLSVDLAVRMAKKYIAEDRFRIQLHDLVMAETDQVVLAAKALLMQAAPTAPLYLKRIELYESMMDRLLRVLINVAYWGLEQSVSVILGSIERLMMLKSQFVGPSILVNLQIYPATLAFYAAGLGFLAAGNLSALKVLVIDFRTRAGEMNNLVGHAIERLAPQDVLNKDFLNAALDERQYVPYSERVHGLFLRIFADQLLSVVSYDDLFDRFEYLCALVVADARMSKEKSWICGWFGRWIYRNVEYGQNIRVTLKAERDRLGPEWPPIKARIFETLQRFDEVFVKHDQDCASRISLY